MASSAPGNYRQTAEEPAVIKASDAGEEEKKKEGKERERVCSNSQVQALRYGEVRKL